jgi:hypothetical protein
MNHHTTGSRTCQQRSLTVSKQLAELDQDVEPFGLGGHFGLLAPRGGSTDISYEANVRARGVRTIRSLPGGNHASHPDHGPIDQRRTRRTKSASAFRIASSTPAAASVIRALVSRSPRETSSPSTALIGRGERTVMDAGSRCHDSGAEHLRRTHGRAVVGALQGTRAHHPRQGGAGPICPDLLDASRGLCLSSWRQLSFPFFARLRCSGGRGAWSAVRDPGLTRVVLPVARGAPRLGIGIV